MYIYPVLYYTWIMGRALTGVVAMVSPPAEGGRYGEGGR